MKIPTKRQILEQITTRTLQEKIAYLKFIKESIIKQDLLRDSLYKNRVEWIDNKLNILSSTKTIVEKEYGLNRFMD